MTQEDVTGGALWNHGCAAEARMGRGAAGVWTVADATVAQGSDSAAGMAASGWAWLTHSSQCSSAGWKWAATWPASATWLAATIRANSSIRMRALVTMVSF